MRTIFASLSLILAFIVAAPAQARIGMPQSTLSHLVGILSIPQDQLTDGDVDEFSSFFAPSVLYVARGRAGIEELRNITMPFYRTAEVSYYDTPVDPDANHNLEIYVRDSAHLSRGDLVVIEVNTGHHGIGGRHTYITNIRTIGDAVPAEE